MIPRKIIDIIPTPVKKVLDQGLRTCRELTVRYRVMPDFIIIGAQRCGTTSLYRNLVTHPCVVPAFRKEVHFFDNNYKKGVLWYKAHFHTTLYEWYKKKLYNHTVITGEASPYYIFHPRAPLRVFNTVPHVKLIAILRNPVDRAYSHYYHERRRGVETHSFEKALKKEKERLSREGEPLDNSYKFHHQHFSYLVRGIYADQLKAWLQFFPREQLLILTESFFDDIPAGFDRVIHFLGLPPWKIKKYTQYNIAQYPEMNQTTRTWLQKYFEPHNNRLYQLVGRDFGWDTE